MFITLLSVIADCVSASNAELYNRLVYCGASKHHKEISRPVSNGPVHRGGGGLGYIQIESIYVKLLR